VISVASNVVPRHMRSLVDAALAGDLALAVSLSEELFPLTRDLFLESNPIPVKAAMAHLGLLTDGLRLPLTPMTDAARTGLIASVDQLLI
jgi:4-hydroxy-tetrahydrodipicolinate synthase